MPLGGSYRASAVTCHPALAYRARPRNSIGLFASFEPWLCSCPDPEDDRASTREQREQVLGLIAEGVSRRAVAQEVFGDERLRGRVDRIVREARLGGGGLNVEQVLEQLVDSAPDSVDAEEAAPNLEDLVTRYAHELRRRLDDPEERVSAGELLSFARLELWVENKKRVEEANRLTREQGV